MTLAAIELGALLKTVVASFVAAVGTTTVFSLAIFAGLHAGELRRAGRSTAAAAYSAIAALAMAAAAGGVVLGLIVMLSK